MEDAAEANILAMENHDKSEPVNIGAGFEISIRDLTEMIVELTGLRGKITWGCNPARWPDAPNAGPYKGQE